MTYLEQTASQVRFESGERGLRAITRDARVLTSASPNLLSGNVSSFVIAAVWILVKALNSPRRGAEAAAVEPQKFASLRFLEGRRRDERTAHRGGCCRGAPDHRGYHDGRPGKCGRCFADRCIRIGLRSISGLRRRRSARCKAAPARRRANRGRPAGESC